MDILRLQFAEIMCHKSLNLQFAEKKCHKSLITYSGGGHVCERDIHSKRQSTVTFKTIDSRGVGFPSD